MPNDPWSEGILSLIRGSDLKYYYFILFKSYNLFLSSNQNRSCTQIFIFIPVLSSERAGMSILTQIHTLQLCLQEILNCILYGHVASSQAGIRNSRSLGWAGWS